MFREKYFQGFIKQTFHCSALLTRITIFFKEDQFITSKRSQLYGITDFLSACGGLLGLFIGSSILSLIEIVYYVLLRIICKVDETLDDDASDEKRNNV